MLLHLSFVFQKLLYRVRIGNMAALLYTRAGSHALFPGLEGWEIVNVDTGPARCCNPAIVADVCGTCKFRNTSKTLRC